MEYSLTPLGQSPEPLLEAICQWSERRLPEVEEARGRGPLRLRGVAADEAFCGGAPRSSRARPSDAGPRTAVELGPAMRLAPHREVCTRKGYSPECVEE